MPFAGYKDFADCVSKNQDKSNPEAYCGSIKHKVEDNKKEKFKVNKMNYKEKLNSLHESVMKENYKQASKLSKAILDALKKGKSVKEIKWWFDLLHNSRVIDGIEYNGAIAALDAYKKKDMKSFNEKQDSLHESVLSEGFRIRKIDSDHIQYVKNNGDNLTLKKNPIKDKNDWLVYGYIGNKKISKSFIDINKAKNFIKTKESLHESVIKSEAEKIIKELKEAGKTTTYPWDKCIDDQKKAGHSDESAQKICAYIKNNFGPKN